MRVITGVQTGHLALAADALDLLVILLYFAGVRRLARRGRRWSASATAAFVTGVTCLWIAVGSDLANYDDVSAPVHVVQHALLMMIAPPLMALGRPVTLAIQAARRPAQIRIVRVVHSRSVVGLTHPVAGWLVYYGSMFACFLDRDVYRFLLDHPLAHDLSHGLLLIIGCLYWQPLIRGDPSRWRLSHRSCVTSTAGGALSECVLALAVVTRHGPLGPPAAVVLLMLAALTCGMCTVVIARRSPRTAVLATNP
jgi:putative copper resistance protein D